MITLQSQNLHKFLDFSPHKLTFFIKNTKILQVSVSNINITCLSICFLSYMAVLCHLHDNAVTIYIAHQFSNPT